MKNCFTIVTQNQIEESETHFDTDLKEEGEDFSKEDNTRRKY